MLPRWLDPKYLRDLALADDPDRSQLLLGTRAALTVSLATAVLYPAGHALGVPETDSLVGVLAGMMAQATVQDVRRRDQALTLALLPLAGGASLSLAAFAAVSPELGAAAFVAVTFAAIWTRRFGPRGNALGTMAFLTYFFSVFASATTATLPWMLVALAAGVAVAAVVRLLLLPDRAVAAARHSQRALRLGAAAVLRHLADRVGHADFPGRRLRQQIGGLNERTLAACELIRRVPPGEVFPGLSPSEIEEVALDREVALGEVIATARQLDVDQVEPARRALAAAASRLRGSASDPAWGELPGTGGDLDVALRDLLESARPPASGAVHRPPGNEPSATEEPSPALHPETRHAIQASLAAGVAIAVGWVVSPRRYYWAVIAAFVVFLGASHRNQMLERAWFRIAGTVLGVVLGLGLGTLVRGNPRLDLVLLLLTVFLAFRMLNRAYGVFVFFITVALVLLYAEMGRYSPALLWIRLEETLIGAVAGAVMAILVLPERSGPRIEAALATVLDNVARNLEKGRDGPAPAADLRALNHSVSRLRAAAGPVTGTFERLTPGLARRVHATTALAFYARQLGATGLEGLAGDERPRANERLGELASLARQAAGSLRSGQDPAPHDRPRPACGSRPRAIQEMERMDELFAALGG